MHHRNSIFGFEPHLWYGQWKRSPLGISVKVLALVGAAVGGAPGALVGGVAGLVIDLWRREDLPQ